MGAMNKGGRRRAQLKIWVPNAMLDCANGPTGTLFSLVNGSPDGLSGYSATETQV